MCSMAQQPPCTRHHKALAACMCCSEDLSDAQQRVAESQAAGLTTVWATQISLVCVTTTCGSTLHEAESYGPTSPACVYRACSLAALLVVIQTEEEQQGLEPQALGEPSSDMDIPHLAYIPDP
mmetsp:Transcript_41720/g.95740  ORF Transcript_41720/g.95740 Transcript_41720/m.95740 type:complete len:123 (-) Transcript_41720:2325-2693(-)